MLSEQKIRNHIMKALILRTTPILTVVAALALLGSASQGLAQANDTQIAASPKGAQFFAEQGVSMDKSATQAVSSTTSVGTTSGTYVVAASPKYHAVLAEEFYQVEAQINNPQAGSSVTAGYRAVGDDGIAASPKLRQILSGQATEIAPLK
jgi:hypothetical protein